jgi:hypothetical protein
VPEGDRGGEGHEGEARERRRHAGQVRRAERIGADMADVHRAVHEAERPEHRGESRPQPGPQAVEDGEGDRRARQREHGRRQVLLHADAGLPVQHRVVERVQHEQRDGRAEEERLAPHRASSRSRKPITRCSYSSGIASIAPV